MSKLKSLLQQDYEESTSMETFDVVVPLRITQSQTSIAIQIEGSQATQQQEQQDQQQQQISATLRNSLIALDINTPRRAPLQITNADVTNDESTFAVLDTPCFKYAIPKFTPVLCRLNAHRSEYDLSNFDIKQPKFILPPPSTTIPPTTLSQPTQASSRVTPPTTNTTSTALTTRDFDFAGVLGAGAFGTVCAAQYKRTGGAVALKVIKKRVSEGKKTKEVSKAEDEDVFGPLPVEAEETGMDGGMVEMGSVTTNHTVMIMKEWFAMQRLAGVEGVVEVLASWHDSDNYFIAMVSLNSTSGFVDVC